MLIELNRKSGTTEYMSLDVFTRWLCLVEAFEFINNKADELNVDITNMLNANAIDNYIKERYHSMRHDVECEIKLGLL